MSLRGHEFILETPSAFKVLQVKIATRQRAKNLGILIQGDPELEKLSPEEKEVNGEKNKELWWEMVIQDIRICETEEKLKKYSNKQIRTMCEQSGGMINSPLIEAAAILTGQDSNQFTMTPITEEDDPFGSPKTTDGE